MRKDKELIEEYLEAQIAKLNGARDISVKSLISHECEMPFRLGLNPIENLWAIIKRSVYSNGKQYSSKNDLWTAIQNAAKAVEPSTVQKLANSVTERIYKVIKSKGSRIGK